MVDIIATLQPAFALKVQKGLAQLQTMDLLFKPYFGLRNPIEQAKLWRQSRSTEEITQTIANLRLQNAHFLADCLQEAGEQKPGPWATNALPGYSWHQYGLAVDCYLMGPDGRAVWQGPQYTTYGSVAATAGMYWGGNFKDYDHWQDSADEPSTHGTPATISAAMYAKWGKVL